MSEQTVRDVFGWTQAAAAASRLERKNAPEYARGRRLKRAAGKRQRSARRAGR